MTGTSQKFPKAARLRRRGDFVGASRGARREVLPHFIMLLARSRGGGRIGITVSRKVGGAVQRNRVKRLVREVFRRHRASYRFGLDLVVIARPGATALAYDDTAAELGPTLRLVGTRVAGG